MMVCVCTKHQTICVGALAIQQLQSLDEAIIGRYLLSKASSSHVKAGL